MKMKNVKWLNVIKLLVLLVCISMIIRDIWLVGFSYIFTDTSYSFTWFGLITFILFGIIANIIIDDFKEQIKSIQSHRPKFAKDTSNRK